MLHTVPSIYRALNKMSAEDDDGDDVTLAKKTMCVYDLKGLGSGMLQLRPLTTSLSQKSTCPCLL